MYDRIRAEARRQRRALLKEIGSRIERSEAVDLANFRKQLDTLASLEALRTPLEQALRSLLPVLIAVLVLWPLWSIHQSAPSVELSARVSRVVVSQDTQEKLDLGGLGQVHTLRVEGLDSLDSDLGDIDFANAAGNGTVYLNGQSYVTGIELSPLELNEPDNDDEHRPVKRVAFSKHAQLGELDVKNFRVHIRANFEQTMQVVSSAAGQTHDVTPPDAILDLKGPAVEPTRVRLFFRLGDRPVEFPVVRPRGLILRDTAFNTRGKRESFSSIEHGTLTMVGTGRKHELLRDMPLSLGELDGTLRVTLASDGLDVVFHGTAGVVGLGGADKSPIRDLRPSLAEWISSDRNVALAWSSLLFIVGLILTVRRSVFG